MPTVDDADEPIEAVGHSGFDDLAARQAFEDSVRQRLSEIYGANPWLLAVEVLQGGLRAAGQVASSTEQPIMVVGARIGVGPIETSLPYLSLGLDWEHSLMANIRSAQQAMAAPPDDVLAAVDRWDPDRRARAIGAPADETPRLLGRPTFGARPQSWADLEDKLAIRALWADAGIPVAPSAQVPAEDLAAAVDAHRRLATELGTVWAGDNHTGWHGGAQGTFWVPDEAAAAAMGPRLSEYRNIRVMPFVEGVPCSVHGMVVPDGAGASAVVAFRPSEMMVVRDPGAQALVYGRAATFWDPDPADREAMRETTRRIGGELVRRVGFRGAYTVDGVLGADGFVPTEVNTRYGAALQGRTETVAGPPIELSLIHLALIEGLFDDIDLRPLEAWVTASLDGARWASGFLEIERAPDRERVAAVGRSESGELRAIERADGSEPTAIERADGSATDGQEVDTEPLAEVRWGEAMGGGMLMISGTDRIPLGPPTAPLLIEIIGAVDRLWSLGTPPLVAARPVR